MALSVLSNQRTVTTMIKYSMSIFKPWLETFPKNNTGKIIRWPWVETLEKHSTDLVWYPVFIYFLTRAYSKNMEGQDLVLKENPSELGNAQQCANAESPLELPADNHSLCAQDSLSLSDSQEIKVSLGYMTAFSFNCLLTSSHLCVEIAYCKLFYYISNSVRCSV